MTKIMKKLSVMACLSILMVMVFSVTTVSAAIPMQRMPTNHSATFDINSVPRIVGDGFVEFQIPIDAFTPNGVQPRIQSPLTGYAGSFTAVFAPGDQVGRAPFIQLDGRIDSIPTTAQITNVNVTYQITTDRLIGVNTHTVFVTHMNHHPTTMQARFDAVPGRTDQNINNSMLNGRDPWGIWQVHMTAVRTITNPSMDRGAVASVRSVNLRIDFR